MQRFNYHTHTHRCKHADLDYSDEEYVLDFIKAGFKKIAFTDHCPEKNLIDTRATQRMSYEQRLEYLESIRKLKEKYESKIIIQSGYEIEYLPGEEENLKELKDETDKLILGQHFIYDDNKNLRIFGRVDFSDEELIRYSKYVEKAMELNLPNIIAHPDIYMMKRKDFGETEEKVANTICLAAQKYNIPLEINLNDIFYKTYFIGKKLNNDSIEKQKEKLINIQYPCKNFWNIAKEYDIKVVYGIDAHYKGQIALWEKLLELAHSLLGDEIIENLNFIEDINL